MIKLLRFCFKHNIEMFVRNDESLEVITLRFRRGDKGYGKCFSWFELMAFNDDFGFLETIIIMELTKEFELGVDENGEKK